MPEYLITTDSNYARERTGIRKITILYVIPGPAEDGGAEPYDVLDDWKPQSRPLELPETERRATKRTDGAWDLAITFEGMPAGAKAVGFVEFDHSGQESPIESFPKFEELAKKYKPAPPITNSDTDGPRFKAWSYKIDDPKTGKKVLNPIFGQSTFADDNTVLRVTFAYGQFLPLLFRDVCKIEEPIVPEGMSEIKKVDENQSWLKRVARGRWRGNVWEYELEYYLGRWNPDIYGTINSRIATAPKITGPDGANLNTTA